MKIKQLINTVLVLAGAAGIIGCSNDEPQVEMSLEASRAAEVSNVRTPYEAAGVAQVAVSSLGTESKSDPMRRLRAKEAYTVTAYNNGHRTEAIDTNTIIVNKH